MTDLKGKKIWLTWEFQRRNRGLANALGFKLYELDIKASRLLRYIRCLYETINILISEKPNIVIVQNPSIILTVFGLFARSIFRYKIGVDAHNSGIYPLEGRLWILVLISVWIQKKADFIIVTNEELRKLVNANGGRGLILPDRLPTPPDKIQPISLWGRVNIVYICTFSEDEPFREVLKAANLLPQDMVVYFTGNFRGKIDEHNVPGNVKLLGYVSEEEYWSFLQSADIVMDLTMRENCLVCGAYEALVLNKPMILSDTKALRSYFSTGCIFVKPDYGAIAHGIKEAAINLPRLKREAQLLRNEVNKKWNKYFNKVKPYIEALI